MDQRVLAQSRDRRGHSLAFVSGIDARRKTAEGDAQLDAVEHGHEVKEQGR